MSFIVLVEMAIDAGIFVMYPKERPHFSLEKSTIDKLTLPHMGWPLITCTARRSGYSTRPN